MEVFFDYRKTGEKIRRCRRSKGLTQKALAAAVNRTESSIQKYEKGEVEIPNSVLAHIAKALGVSLEYLLNDEPFEKITESERLSSLSNRLYQYGTAGLIPNALNLHRQQDAVEPILQGVIDKLPQKEKELLACYQKLNESGRREALKRVRELAQISDYT